MDSHSDPTPTAARLTGHDFDDAVAGLERLFTLFAAASKTVELLRAFRQEEAQAEGWAERTRKAKEEHALAVDHMAKAQHRARTDAEAIAAEARATVERVEQERTVAIDALAHVQAQVEHAKAELADLQAKAEKLDQQRKRMLAQLSGE